MKKNTLPNLKPTLPASSRKHKPQTQANQTQATSLLKPRNPLAYHHFYPNLKTILIPQQNQPMSRR